MLYTPTRHRMLHAISAGGIVMVPKNNRGDLKPRALDQKGLFNLSFAEAKAVNEIVRHPKFGEIPLVYVGMVRGNEGAPVWISSEGLVLLTEWNAR